MADQWIDLQNAFTKYNSDRVDGQIYRWTER